VTRGLNEIPGPEVGSTRCAGDGQESTSSASRPVDPLRAAELVDGGSRVRAKVVVVGRSNVWNCRRIDAPRRLVHTFVFPNLPDAPTLVTWTLEPTATGTRVTVTHARFDGETKTYKAVFGSWPKILGLFKRVIETGDVGFGTKFQQGLMSAFCFILPKSLRTEVVEAELAKRPPRVK
jgi:hypothetical protein